MNKSHLHRWDIFCRVIDNYGDIGVCWRLAKQLAREYPFHLRLWVDNLTALAHLCPAATTAERQWLDGVEVRQWQNFMTGLDPADVVIEAFACDLPPIYLAAMKQRSRAPVWLNLEYLSAESWVEECHGLVSIHPELGLRKHFFFPGFTLKTGGLLRERDLAPQREQFVRRKKRTEFLRNFSISPDDFLVSLFGYENRALDSLLQTWIASPHALTCLVPESRMLPRVNAALGMNLSSGQPHRRGNLTLMALPFLAQTDYDHLLWACDLNFVRGEDSFVRAQWAAKPLVWQIYPQDENAHLPKLNAFLDRYLSSAGPALQEAVRNLHRAWNLQEDSSHAWSQCMATYGNWLSHSEKWCHALRNTEDLAAKLVQFCEKTL